MTALGNTAAETELANDKTGGGTSWPFPLQLFCVSMHSYTLVQVPGEAGRQLWMSCCLTNFLFSCLCMNHVCVGGKCCGDQERTLDSRELELQVIASIQMWMLETELRSLKDQ